MSSPLKNPTGLYTDQGISEAPPAGNPPPTSNKTAFVLFSESLTAVDLREGHLTRVADKWRQLSSKDRALWEEKAREDKLRYATEKKAYTGVWKIKKRRAKKDPRAPKRPMSAFLKYSKKMRKKMREENPSVENSDISRILGAQWRSLPDHIRKVFVDEEKEEREVYKKEISKFRASLSRQDAASRTSHQRVQRMVDYPQTGYQNHQHREYGNPYQMSSRNSENIEPYALDHDHTNSYRSYSHHRNDQYLFHSQSSLGDSAYQSRDSHGQAPSQFLVTEPSTPAKSYPAEEHQVTRYAEPPPIATRPFHPHQLDDTDVDFPPCHLTDSTSYFHPTDYPQFR